MLEAVYVDVDMGEVVGISPKPSFLVLFNLKELLRTTGAILVTGDPDGLRVGAMSALFGAASGARGNRDLGTLPIYCLNWLFWVILRGGHAFYSGYRDRRRGIGNDMTTDIDQMSGMLTVREVSQFLHVHSNTVRRWSDQGILKTYRIGPRGDRRFRAEDVAVLLLEANSAALPNADGWSSR